METDAVLDCLDADQVPGLKWMGSVLVEWRMVWGSWRLPAVSGECHEPCSVGSCIFGRTKAHRLGPGQSMRVRKREGSGRSSEVRREEGSTVISFRGPDRNFIKPHHFVQSFSAPLVAHPVVFSFHAHQLRMGKYSTPTSWQPPSSQPM